MKDDFFLLIRKKTTRSPSRALDQVILGKAAKRLSPAKTHKLGWTIAALSSSALAIIFWFQFHSANLPSAMMAESPEMLKQMDELEMLVEASEWTDAEWKYIETGES
jgi:hypothetical protein